MKTPTEVGRDFNEYARAWAEHEYRMEVANNVGGIVRDEAVKAERPGDEWGVTDILRRDYAGLAAKFNFTEPTNVVEIGAGGGRSTEVLLDVLGTCVGEYHIIDVADGFVDTLRARIKRPLDIHIVDDVDTSFLQPESIDFVLAQSSWSHISLYDQYRYLRDLRFAMKRGAPIVVIGQFIMGAGDDWTWNRFRRRVYQIDHNIEGVYHEFISVSMLAEMLTRLGYTDIVIFPRGFVARRGNLVNDQFVTHVPTIDYCWVDSLEEWMGQGCTAKQSLPKAAPVDGHVLPSGKKVRASMRRRLDRIRSL